MAERKIYAREGEQITCENGHVICEVARDVHYGDLQDPATDCRNWTQPMPTVGTRECSCATCGAAFVRFVPYQIMHFSSGYRV